MSPRRSEQQGGYVLLLVIFTVTLLALVLGSVAQVQSGITPALRAQRAETERLAAAQSALGRVAFLLLTEPIGRRSVLIGAESNDVAARGGRAASGAVIHELRLDGRYYRLGEDAYLSVQDEAGLLNLNAVDETSMANLIGATGVRAGVAQRLAAEIGDYVDADDLTRAQGAEKDAYARAGLAPPPNVALPNRWSALGALTWSSLPSDSRELLWLFTTVAGAGGVNVNTAPEPVLAAVTGDARRAAAFVRERDASATGEELAQALAGARGSASGVQFATAPGTAFRLIVGSDKNGRWRAVESQVQLAGAESERPYYWRELRSVAGMGGPDQDTAVEALPSSEHIHAP